MKKNSMAAIGLLVAALGIFFVPVSFSVKGFGMVVSPDGIRSIRSLSEGDVFQIEPKEGGIFDPGDIISVVLPEGTVTKNRFARQKLQTDLIDVETKQGEKIAHLRAEISRAQGMHAALLARIDSSEVRGERVEGLEHEIVDFRNATRNKIDALAESRLDELSALEGLLRDAEENQSMPEQKRLQMMQQIFSDRTVALSGPTSGYSTDQMFLTLSKEREQIAFSLKIDRAEQEVLEESISEMLERLDKLLNLQQMMIEEARTRYLASLALPEVSFALGRTQDLRIIYGNRSKVSRGEIMRIVESDRHEPGLYIVAYGVPESLIMTLRTAIGKPIEIELTQPLNDTREIFEKLGWQIGEVQQDSWAVQSAEVHSFFVPLRSLHGIESENFEILGLRAETGDGVPVATDFTLLSPSEAAKASTDPKIILGFIENSKALVLSPDQSVIGTMRDPRDSTTLVVHGNIQSIEQSTIDHAEMAARLGNQIIAKQVLAGKALSQVAIKFEEPQPSLMSDIRGAVIQLSFPMSKVSIFDYLRTLNAS